MSEIRYAKLGDVPGILAVNRKHLKRDVSAGDSGTGFLFSRLTRDGVRHALRSPLSYVFMVAHSEGKVNGYAWGMPWLAWVKRNPDFHLGLSVPDDVRQLLQKGRVLHVNQYVKSAPERGLGKRLIQSIEAHAKKEGFDAVSGVVLHEPVANAPSKRTVTNLGYSCVGALHDEHGTWGFYLKKLGGGR